MKSRKIPATMVTQHPDHASKPYWHYKPYISTQYEAEEAFRSFSELGATEYKWDWEGKLVDESVVERLFGEHFDYFSKYPLGQKRFLTFRLPNPRVETEFRLIRAFINMASGASVAKHFGFSVPPLFEVILPLTETAEEMLSLQEAFQEIHSLKHPLFKLGGFLTNLRIIPLFETVPTIINSDKILKKYLLLYEKKFHKKPPYMRPYVARSDPALNSGIIPTVLAIKIALSRYKEISKKEKIPFYPVIGAACLPFRGGLTPETAADFINEYNGVRTTTIQSAFRYDYPLKKVITAISYLEKEFPKKSARSINPSEEKKLIMIINEGENAYKRVIENIAPIINIVATGIPKRRERFLHIGLFGYSRGEGKTKLPRAISFTCALYSIGVPPEFIGTGQTIVFAKKTGLLVLLEKNYINIKKDIIRSGKFLNKNNLHKLARVSGGWKDIIESIEEIEEYVGQSLGPVTVEEKKHQTLTQKILLSLENKKMLSQYIKQAAIIRKSLG
ncbi:MAG: phosphoenolpyruvate carboxylase [Candidatus Levyibacteriota bacterium]